MEAKRILDFLRKVAKSFGTNWGLKLVSLAFAILLWNYVVGEANPNVVVPLSGIKVVFDDNGLRTLANSKFTVSGKLPDKYINVSVQLRRNEVSQLTKDDIRAVVDLSGITTEGEKTVKIRVSSLRGTLKSISADSLAINIEKLEQKPVPVQVNQTGKLPDGYWMGTPVADPTTLVISGASSKVKTVAKAVVTINLDGLASDTSTALDYTLLDGNGKEVNTDGLDFTSSGIVNLQVQPTKSVKISWDKSINGSPARGYNWTDTDVEPKEILIAGPADVLASIDMLPLGRIDITGAKSNISVSKTLDLPKDVHAVSGNTVQVLITIRMAEKTITLDNLPVTVIGLGTGLKADNKLTATAVITCPELVADSVRASKVHLYVDATGLTAGTHTLPVLSEINNLTDYTFTVELKPTDVLVTIASTSTP